MNSNSAELRSTPGEEDHHVMQGSPAPVQEHGASSDASYGARRLQPIEGLRSYLAMWVLWSHALYLGGYRKDSLEGLPELINKLLMIKGAYAVDVFIIISGFVIMLSLDRQLETYGQFIVRRFCRLFPVFIVLFAVGIPLSQVFMWNMAQDTQYLGPAHWEDTIALVETWWANIQWHIPLHLLMIHGAVPEIWLKDAPAAFLPPAWVVSLEWQFYLAAPLAYAWAVSARPSRRLGLSVLCLALFVVARNMLPQVKFGAALPFHVEFFYLGAASYFFYRRQVERPLSDRAFPVAGCLAVFVLILGDKAFPLLPAALWIAFMGLLLEEPSSFSSRVMLPLLTNRFVRYLGRISYSLYLSHFLLMTVVQYALLMWAPHLSRLVHLVILVACTTTGSIAIATVLYRCIEVPGIRAGYALARWFWPTGQSANLSNVSVSEESSSSMGHEPSASSRFRAA